MANAREFAAVRYSSADCQAQRRFFFYIFEFLVPTPTQHFFLFKDILIPSGKPNDAFFFQKKKDILVPSGKPDAAHSLGLGRWLGVCVATGRALYWLY
jgi:hypothetical protein